MTYCDHCMTPMEGGAACCPHCQKAALTEVPAHHLMPKTVLHEKYLVGASLGEGGFGITYIGRDLTLDMPIAIKEYFPNGCVNRTNTVTMDVKSLTSENCREFFEKGKERFLREARILARFSGEAGIVNVRDFFEENNTAYIVMEYLNGETLKDYLTRQGKLTDEQSVRLLMPVMLSLQKIHEQGLIHRDISPDNIMLLGNRVKLLDFGAARDVSATGQKSLSVMLKPGYAPEEQYRSKGEQGPWTDVYALCATLYKCITGVTPDDSTQRVYRDELQAPSALGIAVNETFERALMKGLAVFKKDRYGSVEELIDGLTGKVPAPPIVAAAKPVSAAPTAQPTVMGNDEMTSYQPAAGERPFADSMAAPMTASAPVYTPAAPENEPAPVYTPAETASAVADEPKKPKKEKKEKKFGKNLWKFLLLGVLAVVVIVGVSLAFKAANTVVIGEKSEKVSKSEPELMLWGETISCKDTEEISKLNNLEKLQFVLCDFEEGAVKNLGNIKCALSRLSIDECTGVDDVSFISNLECLTSLELSTVGLTDEQLAKIDFSKLKLLQELSVSSNGDITSLEPLKNGSGALTNIDVDGTQVTDFSPLDNCQYLQSVFASGTGLTDEGLASIKSKCITWLDINKNRITDLSSLKNFLGLDHLDACDNQIKDVSPLAACEALREVTLNNNQITDISPLAQCQALVDLSVSGNQLTNVKNASFRRLLDLDLSENQLTSLEGLSGIRELWNLYVNNNCLTNLDGIETAIKLQTIDASNNKLTDIDGLGNSTVLQKVDLSNNKLTDIKLLAKSAATLTSLSFNDNQVSDLSPLKGTPVLRYLSFDHNKVKTLDALSASPSLYAISAEENGITSIEGLAAAGAVELSYLFLPRNEISDMSPIANMTRQDEDHSYKDIAMIDLSSNNISELVLSETEKYSFLAVYNNPITSLESVKKADGNYMLFTYDEKMNFEGLGGIFNHYTVVDCPLDKQVATEDTLSGTYALMVSFATAEQADAEILAQKESVFPTVKSTGASEEETSATDAVAKE